MLLKAILYLYLILSAAVVFSKEIPIIVISPGKTPSVL